MNVIGTVESEMSYDEINLYDPITVGVAQWYGNRAAALLDRFKNENPSSWTGVSASLNNYLTTYPSTDPIWPSVYLDSTDAAGLEPVLRANVAIQNNQFLTDIQQYASVAQNQGMDINANTDSLIFWETMYHQNPREALAVMAAAGPNASLDRYRTICANDPIFSQYPQRYGTAYSMITAGTANGAPPTTATPSTPTTQSGNTGGSAGASQALGQVALVTKVGDHVQVSGSTAKTMAYSDGKGHWISSDPYAPGSMPVAQPPANPNPPSPPSGGSTKGGALVDWMAQHADAYAYGQGPGRLEPDTSGYTDCSGLCYWCYMQVLGINIGTWGGDQINNGTLVATGTNSIDTSSLQPGDLIFYEWQGGNPVTYDHTAMYAGNGQVWSHGGGQGPNLIAITGQYQGVTPVAIMARRYI